MASPALHSANSLSDPSDLGKEIFKIRRRVAKNAVQLQRRGSQQAGPGWQRRGPIDQCHRRPAIRVFLLQLNLPTLLHKFAWRLIVILEGGSVAHH